MTIPIRQTNDFGEQVYKWENNIHPDNPNFMQRVIWRMWVKPDGKITIGYKLDSNGKMKFLIPEPTMIENLNKYCPVS